jgi:hypothetical protein
MELLLPSEGGMKHVVEVKLKGSRNAIVVANANTTRVIVKIVVLPRQSLCQRAKRSTESSSTSKVPGASAIDSAVPSRPISF